MRKYTLVLHTYIGFGSYVVGFKRIECQPLTLKNYRKRLDLHFIIPGWPKIQGVDGQDYFAKGQNRVTVCD